MRKILFTGGGTGGHIYPLVAIAREIRRMCPGEDPKLIYMGPKDPFGEILLSQEGIKIKNVLSGKLRRYLTFKSVLENILDVGIKIPIGIIQALFYVFFSAPDLVLSKGGFGSIPGTLAGWLMGTPVILHESDIAPGLANRILSKLALEIFVSFSAQETEYFPLKKTISVGNPIRREITYGTKEEAKMFFKLTGEKPVIFIMGGSQGAQRINDKVLENFEELLKNFEVIHQCGEKNFKSAKEESKVIMKKELEKYYHLYDLLNDSELAQAYKAADLIVSRAGSGSIFEIAAVGKPSILIPLPESAQEHQAKNAYAFADRKACMVIEEENFTSHFFLERLKYIFSSSEKFEEMAKNAKAFARPNAGRIIANYLIEFIQS